MTKNILKTALLVLGAGSLVTGCDLEQPEAPCFVQDSPSWAVKYDVVDSPKDANNAACTVVAPTAELIGVFKFVNPDTGATQLTLRPAGLASRSLRDNPDPNDKTYSQTAISSLAVEPDAEDFCLAPEFSPATVDAAAVPATATAPAVPATEVTYKFSNVRVYSAPSAPGTQLTGELRYERDGCISTYVMRALWPAVGCDTESELPEENCGEGSGLNPDFAATCDEVSHFCVPAKAIPSFVDNEG